MKSSLKIVSRLFGSSNLDFVLQDADTFIEKSILVLCITSLVLMLIYLFKKTIYDLKINSIEQYKKNENSKKEFHLYLLFIGISIILTELIYEIFEVRKNSLFITNILIGCGFILIYQLLKRSKFLYKRIQIIFTILFILHFCNISYNTINQADNSISIIAFLIAYFYSYSIIKPIKFYYYFTVAVFCFLFTSFFFNLFSTKLIITAINYSIVILVINQIRHVISLNITNQLKFSNEIIQKGTTLTLACNKRGEVVFCSDTITEILGYSRKEILGMGYWKLTEDPEFVGKKYHQNTISEDLYVRKLRCKDGNFKYIQWKDKKFSQDLIVGIGQDITKEINLKNQYKNLVQTATDIIFEMNSEGRLTFINDFALTSLKYKEIDIINHQFSEFIRPDFIEKISDFYEKLDRTETRFPTIEVPLLDKYKNTVWVSQRVIVRRDDLGNITGFSGIARDITEEVTRKKEKNIRFLKIQNYNQTTQNLSTTNYNKFDTLKDAIDLILIEASNAIQKNKISYWSYTPQEVKCQNVYRNNINAPEIKKLSFNRNEIPIYFQTIEKKGFIIAPDVNNQYETSEFKSNYFNEKNVKSLLDAPIFIDGDLNGIVCVESSETRNWDNEDINFIKTISDIISLAIISHEKLEAEKKLEIKNNLLSALAKCTEKFLMSKNITEIAIETFETIGKASNVDHIFYYEKNTTSGITSQKYKWAREGVPYEIKSPIDYDEDKINLIYSLTEDSKVLQLHTEKLPDSFFKETLHSNNIKSLLAFPLHIGDEFVGFIGFDDCTSERNWTEEEVYILQTFVNNISTVLERNRNEERIYQSEEKFRLISSNIPGTVYLSKFDNLSTKVFLNDEIENLTGYPKTDFLQNNLSFLSLIHPDDKEEVIKKQKKNIKKGKSIYSKYRIQKKSGEYIWIEEFGDAIMKDGVIDYVGGIYFDITNKKESEDAIKAKKVAEAANKSKSEFLANMSHEIRTPLNGIIGFTNLLINTNLEDIQKKYLQTVNQSANSLLDIINDILDFSKIEAGKLDLNLTPNSLSEISNQIIDLIYYESSLKGIQLVLNINEDVPDNIWIDMVRIKQILINLLANSVKFTEKGSIQLNISLLKKLTDNQYKIRFSVIDTGIGIQDESQKKIFKAFSQEDTSPSRKFGGTGLGLTISNKLLELMNSNLQLKSTVDIGSNFYFDLILKTWAHDNPDYFANETANDEVKLEVLKSDTDFSVLIVEDNNINTLLLKTLIKNLFSKTVIYEAINGKEALNLFKKHKPDIVFMDIQMPIMNGYQATKAIRKIKSGKNVPIIAVTAGAEADEKQKCIALGMNDYISKPIKKETIEKIILKFITDS